MDIRYPGAHEKPGGQGITLDTVSEVVPAPYRPLAVAVRQVVDHFG